MYPALVSVPLPEITTGLGVGAGICKVYIHISMTFVNGSSSKHRLHTRYKGHTQLTGAGVGEGVGAEVTKGTGLCIVEVKIRIKNNPY